MEKPKTPPPAATAASALGRAALTYALGPVKTPRPVPAAAYGDAPTTGSPAARALAAKAARAKIVGLARRLSRLSYTAENTAVDPNEREYAEMELIYAVEEMEELTGTILKGPGVYDTPR